MVRGVLMTITWRTITSTTSYYADIDMFNDLAVKRHTEILLVNILNDLDADFDRIFSNGTTGIAFLVTKPLTRKVVLLDDEDDIVMQRAQMQPGETTENI